MAEQVSRIAGKNLLLALFDIAYRSRLGLPLIVSAGLMLFDVHLRLEVGFEGHVEQEVEVAVDEEGDDHRDRRRHHAQE